MERDRVRRCRRAPPKDRRVLQRRRFIELSLGAVGATVLTGAFSRSAQAAEGALASEWSTAVQPCDGSVVPFHPQQMREVVVVPAGEHAGRLGDEGGA